MQLPLFLADLVDLHINIYKLTSSKTTWHHFLTYPVCVILAMWSPLITNGKDRGTIFYEQGLVAETWCVV